MGMTNGDSKDSVEAEIQYLVKDVLHESEKPYYLYLKYHSDVARTNTKPDSHFVSIYNARNLDVLPHRMFSEWGFTQLPLDCTLRPEEYWDAKKVEDVLYPKYTSLVQSLFPDATRVEVLDHAVRKRDPDWSSDGRERHDLETNQPSDYVHIGMYFKYDGFFCGQVQYKEIRHSSEKLQEIHRRKVELPVQLGNLCSRTYSHPTRFWKPIRGPVYDFPLTLCDRRTIDYASQTTPMDVISEHYVNENARVYHSDNHRWYYWHGLQENEVIAFMQADSEAEDKGGVPHTAFVDPRVGHNTQLRESIEAMVFAYFD